MNLNRAIRWTLLLLAVGAAPALHAANMALGKTVLGSSWIDAPADSGNWHYRNLVDGQTDDAWGNIWLLPNGTAGWATVDLGAEYDLTRIRVEDSFNSANRDRGTKDYRVWVTNTQSNNLADYGTPLRTGQFVAPNASAPPTVEFKFPVATHGRYVTVASDTWYGGGGGLGEIEALNTPLIAYLEPTKVNLLRRVNAAGALPVVTASKPGSGDHTPDKLIDAGQYPWRLESHGSSEWWRIELPEPVLMDTFKMTERGSYYGTAYTVSASDTGWGGLTPIITVSGNTNTTRTHILTQPTWVRYLEVSTTGFASGTIFIPYEYQAFGPANVFHNAGYNLLAEPGHVGTITASMQRKLADTDITRAFDLDAFTTYVRGQNTGTGNCWFVIPLSEPTLLHALSLGMYEDQRWNDARVYLSSDAAYNYLLDGSNNDTWPGMTWRSVYDLASGTFAGTHVAFPDQWVTFVRIEWPSDAAASAALCEVELFAIPEPATLALTAAALLLLAPRRRPSK